jgi:hypothetical protein
VSPGDPVRWFDKRYGWCNGNIVRILTKGPRKDFVEVAGPSGRATIHPDSLRRRP